MVTKFQTKPVVIEVEAVQWNGQNVKEVLDFLNWRNAYHDDVRGLYIMNAQFGYARVTEGYWIVKKPDGTYTVYSEYYFNQKYESIPEKGNAYV